jgi:hypothetical protein
MRLVSNEIGIKAKDCRNRLAHHQSGECNNRISFDPDPAGSLCEEDKLSITAILT